MPRKFLRRFADMPIRARLVLLLALVSIIPVCVIGATSVRVSFNALLEKNVGDSLSRLAFLDYRTQEIIHQKHEDAVLAAYDDSVRAYFDPSCARDPEFPPLDEKVKRVLMSLYHSKETVSIVLAGANGQGFYYSVGEFGVVEAIDAAPYLPIDPSQFAIFDYWGDARTEKGEPAIPYERLVLGKNSNAPVAKLVINLRESLFSALYEGDEARWGGRVLLVNERGVIQSASDKALVGTRLEGSLGVPLSRAVPGGYFIQDQTLWTCLYNSRAGLYFFALIPLAQLSASLRPIVGLTALVALLCIAVCLLLGYYLSRSFTRPLYRLLDRVSAHSPDATRGKNEFVILNDRYAEILAQLESVIGDYYEEQQKKKEAMVRALEFQINPHFLYNTLSTIIWLIDAGEDRAAIRITKELSTFFRISISKGREFIGIQEELTHVKLYVDIQQARYAQRIALFTQVPEEALELMTPKLILQPLVENAIMHAMPVDAQMQLRITIAAHIERDALVFEVIDSGNALTQADCAEMNRFLENRADAPEGEAYGIGISNVHDRVRMCFGPGYGLRFARKEGQTLASVRIKRLPREAAPEKEKEGTHVSHAGGR
ncbi:MAG: histidine kinase [Clostridia bacterium]